MQENSIVTYTVMRTEYDFGYPTHVYLNGRRLRDGEDVIGKDSSEYDKKASVFWIEIHQLDLAKDDVLEFHVFSQISQGALCLTANRCPPRTTEITITPK